MTDKKENHDNLSPNPLQPKRPAKRIIVPKKDAPAVLPLSEATDLLVNDAKLIIAAELSNYRSKVTRGLTLDLKEARVVQGYLAELTKLQREEREQARSNNLNELSNEELLQLAVQLLGNPKPDAGQE